MFCININDLLSLFLYSEFFLEKISLFSCVNVLTYFIE